MANVQLIALAHFYNEGTRGWQGGAPSNDKVWGIAKIQGTLVNFWGRRNGKLKFKTHIDGLFPVAVKLSEKVRKGYTELNANGAAAAQLCPSLVEDVTRFYYSDLARGKVNTSH